jgi:hypothetical protein
MLEQRSAVKHYSGMPAVDHVSYSARSASSNESATFWITGDSEAIQTHLDWRIIANALTEQCGHKTFQISGFWEDYGQLPPYPSLAVWACNGRVADKSTGTDALTFSPSG